PGGPTGQTGKFGSAGLIGLVRFPSSIEATAWRGSSRLQLPPAHSVLSTRLGRAETNRSRSPTLVAPSPNCRSAIPTAGALWSGLVDSLIKTICIHLRAVPQATIRAPRLHSPAAPTLKSVTPPNP